MKTVTDQMPKTNRKTHFSYLLLFLLIFSFVLVACERAVPREDVTEPPQDTVQLEPPQEIPSDPIDPAPPVDNGDPPPPDAQPPTDEPAPPDDSDEPEEAEPVGDPEEVEQPGPPAETPSTYTVQAGDTLFRIAQRFGTTVDALARANNITNVNRLDVGTVLTIPGEGDLPPDEPGQEQIHVVQAGETFFRIALRYGFTVNELASYNNIADPSRISVGQEIRIPAR